MATDSSASACRSADIRAGDLALSIAFSVAIAAFGGDEVVVRTGADEDD